MRPRTYPAARLWTAAAALGMLAIAAVPFGALVLPLAGGVLLVGAIAAADLAAARRGTPPGVEMKLVRRVGRGRPVTVRGRLTGGGHTSDVTVLEELPDDLGGDVVRTAGSLGPGEMREIGYTFVPRRRGLRPLGPRWLFWTSPLGLFWRRVELRAAGEIEVVPMPGAPERAALDHHSVFAELDVRPRRPRGEGTEFESLREYVPGDDPRHVDWRATARRGRLIVRQHQVERRRTIVVAVETGRLMTARVAGAPKLDHALDAALALTIASLAYGDRVGLLAFDREVRALVRPCDGRAAARRFVDATLPLDPRAVEPSYRVLASALESFQKQRALVVVLTDFVEGSASFELESYLRHLGRRHLVLLVALRDRLFAELDEPARDLSPAAIYRRLALQDVAVERSVALGRIARLGVQTLDLDPAAVTASVVARYLGIRQAGWL